MNKNMKQILLMLIMLIFFPNKVIYAKIFVIVNNSVSEVRLSKKDIKSIYMMKKQEWDNGSSIKPVYLLKGELKTDFVKNIMDKTTDWLEQIYVVRVLTGKGHPPRYLNTENEVLKFVSSTDGAIGFVSKTDDSVKTVFTIE